MANGVPAKRLRHAKPLPRVATGCLRRYMVRSGSTVRVRQRPLRSPARRDFSFRRYLHDLQRAMGMEPFMEPSGRDSPVLRDDLRSKGRPRAMKSSAAASALGQIELSSARVVPVRRGESRTGGGAYDPASERSASLRRDDEEPLRKPAQVCGARSVEDGRRTGRLGPGQVAAQRAGQPRRRAPDHDRVARPSE